MANITLTIKATKEELKADYTAYLMGNLGESEENIRFMLATGFAGVDKMSVKDIIEDEAYIDSLEEGEPFRGIITAYSIFELETDRKIVLQVGKHKFVLYDSEVTEDE